MLTRSQVVTHSYIFLHGLNENAAFYLKKIEDGLFVIPDGFRVILPTAPLREVTVKEGKLMHAWFNVRNFDPKDRL